MRAIISNVEEIAIAAQWLEKEEAKIILNEKPEIGWRKGGEDNPNGYFSALFFKTERGDGYTRRYPFLSVLGGTFEDAEMGAILLKDAIKNELSKRK